MMPHNLLNLIIVGMASKAYPKIPMDEKELIRLYMKQLDATAYYFLKSDKPMFMVSAND